MRSTETLHWCARGINLIGGRGFRPAIRLILPTKVQNYQWNTPNKNAQKLDELWANGLSSAFVKGECLVPLYVPLSSKRLKGGFAVLGSGNFGHVSDVKTYYHINYTIYILNWSKLHSIWMISILRRTRTLTWCHVGFSETTFGCCTCTVSTRSVVTSLIYSNIFQHTLWIPSFAWTGCSIKQHKYK